MLKLLKRLLLKMTEDTISYLIRPIRSEEIILVIVKPPTKINLQDQSAIVGQFHQIFKATPALTCVALPVEPQSTKWKVSGLIRVWVWGQSPVWGGYKKQLIDVSLSHQCFSPFSSSLPLSLKINK